ncbi:MAG: DUF169 domain-containing protein [Candidatus Eremiobacteraeota bacterium]|nr:DUF169 domain-containing protein [Candidatus Eremiobacteraeota bacterium]MBV8339233.1 DUF169 domain-containing protein [Candidatus Eremiobacteraeota bacterium]MBV8460821.1 DUF169 domain-containing protein [Candidatus Eremiobacteraeota bacterium]MBV8667695.1 DUF169 domain-containing protein [Candidatus Eremiobacteraeota bacterium]
MAPETAHTDTKTVAAKLDEFVRPTTFPVAVKFLRKGEAAPPKARRPLADMQRHVTVCQGWAIARRYGWTTVLRAEDMKCPLGALVAGFAVPNAFYEEGNLCAGMYTADAAAGARSEAAVEKFAPGEIDGIVFGPLARVEFEPEILIVYGNAAQVMRLVAGALYKHGGRIHSSFAARMDCSDHLVVPLRTDEPQVILPCNGDRIFAGAQDEEMAYTTPWHKVGDLLEGLEGTHKGGVRYPIPSFLTYEPGMPPKYEELLGMQRDDRSKAGS